MAELLPPAVQEFVINSAGWVRGIDAMVADDVKLADSIKITVDEMRALEVQAAKSAEASAAAMAKAGQARNAAGQFVSGSSGADAAKVQAAVAAEKELTQAERMAAEGAKLEAEMTADLAREQALLANGTKLLNEQLGVEAKAMAINREASAANVSTGEKLAGGMNKLGSATIAASAAFAGYGLHAASEYQAEIVKLKTSAGETGDIMGGKLSGNLKMVSDALLKMSVETGTSTHQLTSGMYMVESAGYSGAKGLEVMKVAAMGARAEQAPLADVTNALTTIMRDFNIQPENAAKAMNTMTVAVGKGKMTMADFASAIGTISPIAQQAGISFGEVSGSMATLTQHGASAHAAVDDLTAVIRGMQAPNMQAVKEMDRMGISASDVSKNLGQRGLVGTLEMYTKAIAAHMKGGQILIDALNHSKTAADNAKAAFAALPANVQKMATAFQQGTITTKDWAKFLKTLPPILANQASQWATAEKRASGFSDLLKSGTPLTQSYAQALTKMTGGTNAFRAALQLTGGNLAETKANVAATSAEWDKGGKSVKGFAEAQQTMKFQMDQAKQAMNALAIQVGTFLIPIVTKFMGLLTKFPAVTKGVLAVVAAFLALAVAMKVVSVVKDFITLVQVIKEWELATKAAAAAQWLLDAALNANPISLIIIAIAALVAGLIYAYTHFKWFHDVVNAMFKGIAAGIGWLVDFVKAHWQLLVILILGPTGVMIVLLVKYWRQIYDAVKTGVMWVIDFVKKWWPLLLIILGGPLGLIVVLVVKYWRQIWNVTKEVFDGIGAAISAVWNGFIKPIFLLMVAILRLVAAIFLWWARGMVVPAVEGVGMAVSALWRDIIEPVFGLIMALVRVVAALFVWWWHNNAEPAFKGIGALAVWLYDNAIKPSFNAIIAAGKAVGTAAVWLYQNAIGPAWRAIAALATWLYRNAIKPAWDGIIAAGKAVGNAASWLYNSAIKPAWNGIRSVIQSAWNSIHAIFNAIVNAANWVGNTVSRIFSGISNTINSVTGGLNSISHALGFAEGGPVPGPAGAPMMAVVHGGEYVLSREMIANITGKGTDSGVRALTTNSVQVSGGNSRPTHVVVVNIHNAGSMLAQRDLEKQIQSAVLQVNVRNPSNNLSLPVGRY